MWINHLTAGHKLYRLKITIFIRIPKEAPMVKKDHETVAPSEPPKVLYRQLLLRGLTPKEAANLIAHMEGLDIIATGWDIKQIEKIMFLRALIEMDKIKK